MKKLLVALSMVFALGFSTTPARANFRINYWDFDIFAQAQYLGGDNVAFVFYCWSYAQCYYPDIFTLHSTGMGANPAYAVLKGAQYGGFGYNCLWDYQDPFPPFLWHYSCYYTPNDGSNWYFVAYLAL